MLKQTQTHAHTPCIEWISASKKLKYGREEIKNVKNLVWASFCSTLLLARTVSATLHSLEEEEEEKRLRRKDESILISFRLFIYSKRDYYYYSFIQKMVILIQSINQSSIHTSNHSFIHSFIHIHSFDLLSNTWMKIKEREKNLNVTLFESTWILNYNHY